LLAALTVSVVLAALGALSGVSRGGEVETKSLKPGEYDGLWHSDRVKFIFEKVHKDGTFSGVVRFPKESRYPDATFVFSGKLSDDGSITINRDPKDDSSIKNPQTSEAKKPKEAKGHLVWEGRTTGKDLDPKEKLPFELRVPLAK
jgi:hypothetical protein